MRRIGLIVTGGVDRSGRERVTPALLWLVERLARDHDVHVFALQYYPEPCTYPLLGATIHDVGRVEGPRALRRWRLRARLARALAAAGPFDALHAYLGMPAIVVAPIARTLGTPLVVTLDSGELVAIDDIAYGLQRRPIDRRALGRALRIASSVTVATEFMARQGAFNATPVSVVPIGIDAALFPLAERTEGPPWRLLRVASLNRVKDYPLLLDTLRRLVALGLDIHVDAVGEDTLGGRVQALARTIGVDSRIVFHGVQPIDRLASFYARAHLHVVSSRHEAASVAVLEAAATGLATVGTRVGYVADWAPEAALAVEVGDAEALATAVVTLLRDPPHRARLAARARAWTLAHDADWTAARFAELYARAATR